MAKKEGYNLGILTKNDSRVNLKLKFMGVAVKLKGDENVRSLTRNEVYSRGMSSRDDGNVKSLVMLAD